MQHPRFPCCRAWAPEHGLSSCGARASSSRGTRDIPGPRIRLVPPALAGGFLTPVPPWTPPCPFACLSCQSRAYRSLEHAKIAHCRTSLCPDMNKYCHSETDVLSVSIHLLTSHMINLSMLPFPCLRPSPSLQCNESLQPGVAYQTSFMLRQIHASIPDTSTRRLYLSLLVFTKIDIRY